MQPGFTLIEVAVALFLLSLLFGSVFLPLRAQVEMRKIEQTKDVLDRAREALLGYAVERGHFPCPATDTSAGHEPPGSDHVSGVCPAYYGFFPAAALGFSPSDMHGYAVDAWAGTDANRLRYAVTSVSAGSAANSNAFTRVHGMRTAGISNLGSSALSLLHVCGSGVGVAAGVSCGSALTLVSTAPVIVWSSGANAVTGGVSVHEAQNPSVKGGSSDRLFVSRVQSDASGNEFDDVLTWIPMPVLIHRMVAAGQLP